jgi:hypothetical protein
VRDGRRGVGERIVVGAGFAVGGLGGKVFSRFPNLILPRGRLEVASRLELRQQRLCRELRYATGYARTTGRRDGLGADGQTTKAVQKWTQHTVKPPGGGTV